MSGSSAFRVFLGLRRRTGTLGISVYSSRLTSFPSRVTVREFWKLHDAYVACGLGDSRGLWAKSTPRPQSEKIVESRKPIQRHSTGQDTARSFRRSHTHGRRERTDQVGAEELGKHQSATSRASSGGSHQRTKDDKVLGLLGRPQRHQDDYCREKPRMNNAPRNLHLAAMVSARKSTRHYRLASACPQSGGADETSPPETKKE